jgi:hypothetical protein
MKYTNNFSISNNTTKSYSQINQDIWVLEKTNYKRNGYYIDIGCADGEKISNTFLLDKHYNWSGLAIDINARNMIDRTCNVFKGLVYDEDKVVEFIKADFNLDFSGIKDHLTNIFRLKDKTKTSPIEKHQTIVTQKVFDAYNVPKYIDFLSLDVEGSELNVLKGIDFNKHIFKIIMIEHNFEQPSRDNIRKYLAERNYKYVTSNQWDDIYMVI